MRTFKLKFITETKQGQKFTTHSKVITCENSTKARRWILDNMNNLPFCSSIEIEEILN